MTRRSATWLAWMLFAVDLVLTAVGWVLTIATDGIAPVFDLASSAALVTLPLVGALIASRRPTNVIGWLFCGAGLLLAVTGAAYGYAGYALVAEPRLAGGVASAWLTSWVFLPALFGIPPLLFLLFPDGRPLSPRWRWAVALTGTGLVSQAVAAAFAAGPLEDSPVPGVVNPVGIESGVLVGVETVGWTATLVGIVLATWSLVLRYRRSSGDQRLQVRWFAFAAVVFVLACLISTVLFQTRYVGLGQVLVLVAFTTIPVAAGIAILRHRLYDIDVVIKRTLVYGSLTATLLATYLLMVLLFRLALSPVTGSSDLAVAGSTLTVAALFRPARARIQGVVDRRFFRRRYDAARTVESFTGRLRQEVDLESVSADLRRVVRETVQPESVSLWMRSPQ